jgi:hypothetical protein
MLAECDRNGCDVIGCIRYSDRYGYICDDCFEELLFWRGGIDEFMYTIKYPQDEKEARKAYFEKVFPE